MTIRWTAAALAILALAACSFQNKYERQAQKITEAVMADNLAPVQDEIAKGIDIPRSRVAQWSDELSAQGKLESVREAKDCPAAYHCFDAKFEKHTYFEVMQVNDQGKVSYWHFWRDRALAGSQQ